MDAGRLALGSALGAAPPVEEFARVTGTSAHHLMRLFRAETGLSLRAYRRHLRVAAVLDRTGSATTTVIDAAALDLRSPCVR